MDQYSEDDVRRVLEPFHQRIWHVFQRGFSEWLTIKQCMSEQRIGPVLYPRTATNHIFDAVARNAIKEFGSDPSVSVKTESQTVKFCFRSAVIARFKKGDENHLGQNHPTGAVLNFIDAQQMLPGFPPKAAKVDIIWRLTELEDAIKEVWVSARNGNTTLWSYMILKPEHRSALLPPFLPHVTLRMMIDLLSL